MTTKPKSPPKSYLDRLTFPLVMVCEEKHCTRYFKAGNKEELLASALKLVKDRIKEEWFSGYRLYKPEKPKEPVFSMTLEAAKALPMGAVRQAACAEHAAYQRQLGYYFDELALYELCLKANAGDAAAALDLLRNRQDYEYESFKLEPLE